MVVDSFMLRVVLRFLDETVSSSEKPVVNWNGGLPDSDFVYQTDLVFVD